MLDQLTLTSSDPTTLPIPSPLTIPAGVKRIGIGTTSHAPSAQETVTIRVTYAGVMKSAQVIVDPT